MVETTFETKYTYDQLVPVLTALLDKLNRTPDIEIDGKFSELAKQLYIVYFADQGMFPDKRIAFHDILDYALLVMEENEVVSELLPTDIKEQIRTAISDADNLALFLDDSTPYTYTELLSAIKEYVETVKVMEVELNLSETALMGLYVKYAANENVLETGEISATDLLAFVLDAAENNELLSGRITPDMMDTITESKENMASAEGLLKSDKYSRILLTVTLPPESAESREFVEYLSAKVREIFGEGAYVAGEIATTNDLTKAFDADNKLISIFTVISIFLIIMIVFKSLSLPVILVAIIQGAIWIAMSLSSFGDPMFFMSYIMSMCILMGATIDYGILLSTNYVRARETLDRDEALAKAMNGALPTIFTSGIILMVCGAVVGFIASQTSISSVGFLLFRGTLVSTIMVTIVLPALLYMLDRLVIGLTLKSKK
jgi:predicted RND superfamily exporter protein